MKQVPSAPYRNRKSWIIKTDERGSRHHYLGIGSIFFEGTVWNGICIFDSYFSKAHDSPLLQAVSQHPGPHSGTLSIRQQQKLLNRFAAGGEKVVVNFNSAAYISSVNLGEGRVFDIANFGQVVENYKTGNIALNCEKLGLPRPTSVAGAVYLRLKNEFEKHLSKSPYITELVNSDGKYRELAALKESLDLRSAELAAKKRNIETAHAEADKQSDEAYAEMSARRQEIILAEIAETLQKLGAHD